MSAIVLLCSDRVGFGHIRGMLAVEDALKSIGIATESVFTSQWSSLLYRWAWRLLDHGLRIPYKLFPEQYAGLRHDTSANSMQLINTWMRRLDAGWFARYAQRRGHQIVVASHVTASNLIRKPGIHVYLLGLDPYAGLYWNSDPNVITTAVDAKTQHDMYALGTKQPRVTGPMIPFAVSNARKHFPERLEELRAGAPLRIAIATGGSLTHGQEITALCGAFARLTSAQKVERISVVVGDSLPMKESVARAAGGDARVSIVYDSDATRLVRAADCAIADADVIIAKTGELAFWVAGGKAFKTFHTHPSLGPQEIAIKEYVAVTSGASGVSALELGLPTAAEVTRILRQRADGSLCDMMAAGLSIPADGAHKVAQMIRQELGSSELANHLQVSPA
jgi:hypothetical protein